MQRRRFSTGATVADVYAWAQLELLQSICPTMDARLQRLRQQAPTPAAAAGDAAKAAKSNKGSGDEAAAEGVAGPSIGQSSAEVPVSDAMLPADAEEGWVQRWTEGAAGNGGGSGWAWRSGWRLVLTYPRRPLPRECAGAEAGSGGTIADAGLAPQAALAVEQLEDDGSR